MCTITIDFPESKKELINSVLSQYPFVKIRNGKKKLISKEKQEILDSIKQGLNEVKLIQEGILKPISIEELYKDLES